MAFQIKLIEDLKPDHQSLMNSSFFASTILLTWPVKKCFVFVSFLPLVMILPTLIFALGAFLSLPSATLGGLVQKQGLAVPPAYGSHQGEVKQIFLDSYNAYKFVFSSLVKKWRVDKLAGSSRMAMTMSPL